jgi:hypothetical protein
VILDQRCRQRLTQATALHAHLSRGRHGIEGLRHGRRDAGRTQSVNEAQQTFLHEPSVATGPEESGEFAVGLAQILLVFEHEVQGLADSGGIELANAQGAEGPRPVERLGDAR